MPTEPNPILNNPYEEPLWHYATNLAGELDYARPVKGRRIFTPEVQSIPVRQGSEDCRAGGESVWRRNNQGVGTPLIPGLTAHPGEA
jgi:hypothetical protein